MLQATINLYVGEAISLLKLLDGSPGELARLAGNYHVSPEDWASWVNTRVKNQLRKAALLLESSESEERTETNDHGGVEFTPVIVDSDCEKRLLAVFPSGKILFIAKGKEDAP